MTHISPSDAAVAMSMVGNMSATFLDEPSTGMDPGTKRYLWDFLAEAQRDQVGASERAQTSAEND